MQWALKTLNHHLYARSQGMKYRKLIRNLPKFNWDNLSNRSKKIWTQWYRDVSQACSHPISNFTGVKAIPRIKPSAAFSIITKALQNHCHLLNSLHSAPRMKFNCKNNQTQYHRNITLKMNWISKAWAYAHSIMIFKVHKPSYATLNNQETTRRWSDRMWA